MKNLLLLFFLLLFHFGAWAQQTTFQERAYRLDATGKFLYGSTLTRQGNILVSGPVNKSGDWDKNIFMLLNPNLDTIWTKAGPVVSDVEQEVRETKDGGFIMAGTVYQQNGSRKSFDGLLHRLNSIGQPVWSKTYDASNGSFYSDEGFRSMVILPDNGYIVGGFGNSLNKQKFYSIMRTDSLGNILWRRSYDWSFLDYLNSICLTHSGNILTVGGTKYNMPKYHLKLLLINTSGDSLKSSSIIATHPNQEEGTFGGIISLSDGGFIIPANADTLINGVNAGVGMIIKVDANLQLVWKHIYRPIPLPYRNFSRVKELSDGSIIALGYDYPYYNQAGSNKFYLHHISANGQPINIYTFPSLNYTRLITDAMEALPDSSFVVGGRCSGNGQVGFYVAKVKIPGLPRVISSIKAETIIPTFALGQSYPNPTPALASIPYTLPHHYTKASILIREIATGREIKRYELKRNSSSLNVDLSHLSNGLYLYSLVVDEQPVATKKLAVMK